MTVTIEQLTINFDGGVILLGGLLIIAIIWYTICTSQSTSILLKVELSLFYLSLFGGGIRTDSVPRTLRGLFIFCATLTLYEDYPSPIHIQTSILTPTSYQPF